MSRFDALSRTMSDIVFDVYGVPVVVRREGEPPAAVTGIFEAAHTEVDLKSGVPVSSVHPQVEIRDWTLPWSIDEEDRVEIGGVTYSVTDARPGGNGHVLVNLQKAGRRRQ